MDTDGQIVEWIHSKKGNPVFLESIDIWCLNPNESLDSQEQIMSDIRENLLRRYSRDQVADVLSKFQNEIKPILDSIPYNQAQTTIKDIFSEEGYPLIDHEFELQVKRNPEQMRSLQFTAEFLSRKSIAWKQELLEADKRIFDTSVENADDSTLSDFDELVE